MIKIFIKKHVFFFQNFGSSDFWTTCTSQKFAIFDQKIRQEVKKSVPFVRYPSCGETTIYITFLKSISFAVLNIKALQHSQMSEFHFEMCGFFWPKKPQLRLKKKPPFKG